MNREQYKIRELAWKEFHLWEKDRQYREYSGMSYEKRSEIGQMLFESALQSNLGYLERDENSQLNFQHKCQMVELRTRLRSVH